MGGAGRGELITAQEHAGHWVVRVALCMPRFVLYILISVVLTVHFLCCSVKLPLSQPTSFAFFFRFASPPQGGEAIEQPRGPLLLARAKP